MIKTAGDMLSRLVITADKNDRAWHSYGESDPEGFAAMGVVEVSVHTYDLALGFGIEFTPLNEPSEFAIRRLFLDTVELPSQYFSNYSWGNYYFGTRVEFHLVAYPVELDGSGTAKFVKF